MPLSLRRNLHRVLWTLVALALLLVAGVVYVALVGITVDASALRSRVARELSARLGRPVVFDGPVQLEVSVHPRLRIAGLRIAGATGPPAVNASASGTPDLVSVGEAHFGLDAWPLLLNRGWHIQELEGSDVKVRLQRSADGRGNWEFDRAADPPAAMPATTAATTATTATTAAAPARTAAAASEPAAGTRLPVAIRVDRMTLHRVAVEYVGTDAQSHYFDLDSLDGEAPGGEPARLTLRGSIEKRFPYQLAITGGALDTLLAGGKDWPIDLSLSFLGSAAQASGSLVHAPDGWRGALTVGLGTPDTAEIERLLQTTLPAVGATALAGNIRFEPGKVSVKSLQGSMGQTSLTGELDVDLKGPRPRVSGTLDVPNLDMRPFLKQPAAADAPQAQTLSQWYREISRASFDLGELVAFDADIDLRVDRWASLPGDVRDARLQLKLAGGRLDAPLKVTVAGVTLDGELSADATAKVPTFELAVGTRDTRLGGLAELLLGLKGIEGALGGFVLRVTAEGSRVRDLVKTLDVRMVVSRGGLTYGNHDGGQPVAFGLDSLELTVPAGQALNVQARGSLLDQPVTATVSGAALDQMMRGRAPIEISATSRSLRARVHGTLDDPAGTGGPELSLSLAASRLSDATRWLKLSAGAADLPLAIEGKARWHDNEWSISGLKFAVGRNALTGDFAQSRQGTRPVLRVRLVADTLDLAELQTMLPKSDGHAGSGERPMLDLPILPAGIDLSDTDFQVDVKRLAGSGLPLTDLKFNAQMRDGRMLASPFSANVSGTRFDGAIALDLRGKQPQAELWLGAEDADIGRMLRSLGLVENIEASAGRLVVHGVARGARLGELAERSELLAELASGRIVLSDPNTRAQAVIRLDNGTLRADPGAPVTLALKGDLDGTPVAIDLQSGKLAELVRPDQQVRFNLKADAADARLEIVGNVQRPISARELEFALSLSGPRLDTFSAIARTPLPPWGSYSLIGRLKLSRSGYEVAGMRLRVGESTLRGDGRLDTTLTPPRLAVTLTAPSIQLDDFKLGDWWPVEKKAVADQAAAPKPLTADELRNQAAQASAQAEKLLSPEMLRRQDATLNIQVDQVLSGKDVLGSGRLAATIDKGRADLGPVEVAVPGGSARLAFAFEPTGRDVNAEAHIQVEHFDYGILARRALPNSDLRGSFSLQFDVASKAPSLAQAMQHGNGAIDFTVWPENLRAGVFDLWAANLFVSLAAKVDPSSASKINCGVGRFTLTDGVLTGRQILLDTTRVRVQGQGKADFHDESIALRLRPTPKQAQFFSLATPIQVSGSFTEPKIGVDPGAVLETAARLATSLLWVPVQKLIGKEVPADGSDVCERTPR